MPQDVVEETLRRAAAIAYRHRDEWLEDAADRQRDGELFSRQVARAREAEAIGDEIMAMVKKMKEGRDACTGLRRARL